MKKQTQEQFLETIDGLLAINEQLRKDLAEREAEIAKLRDGLLCEKALIDTPIARRKLNIEADNEFLLCIREALSTPPSTSYLEQYIKEKYGEPVGHVDYGDRVEWYKRPAPETNLYARKESK